MKSPFKFLDSYTKEDRDVFFGREREIEELYHRVFESKIMLVYGVSGTGKSSLIHCGLANKFQETDWLPLVIRRGANMLDSLVTAIKSASITPQSGEMQTAPQFKKAVRSLYLDHYKPVFFIFDQFEELFIFGTKEEDESFLKVLKSLLSSDIQCKFIFILREEYLGWLSTFENSISGFFANRIRIEKMDIGNARKVIEGPCKIFNISVEEGFAEKMLEKLCPPKESEIELTYLQVYLDKIFRLASENNPGESNITFHISDLDKAGNVYDILGSFLDEQISHLPEPEMAMAVLKAFVSARGTKRPVNVEEIREYALTTGRDIDEKTINELLISFVNLRILQEKDKNEKYELRHDALASKIFEKITLVEKELLEIRQLIENALHNWQKREVLLSQDDLQYIAPYEARLYLPDDHKKLIESSKKELLKARHRRRNIIAAAAIVLIVVLAGFSIWALKERKNAVEKEGIAREEKIKATESEKQAIISRDKAIESDNKAVESEKEAIKARDVAKESQIRATHEKDIAEKREIQARANNFNFQSKEMVSQDPTIALQLAMYALSLDSGNKAILSNLNRIYYDNSFYKILFRVPEGSLIQISPDWKKILSSYGRTAKICDINGGNSHLLFGHLINVVVINSVHNISRKYFDNDYITSFAFSPDGSLVLTGSQDKTARLWDLNGNNLQIFKGHLNNISSVAFSPDGKKVLTGSFDRTAKLWDLKGNCLKTFTGHRYGILSVAFSPDGQSILTGSADSTAIQWDLAGKVLQTFKGHTGNFLRVAFSKDGKTILTGSSDQTARLWDLSGKTIQILSGHTDNVTAVAFSPDGKTIMTGSSDNTARLWDIHGNTLQVFKGHTTYIYSIAYSPDGKKILTSSEDGTARVWDISNTSNVTLTGHKSYIYRAAFSPDGKTILTMSEDKTVRVWDTDGNNVRSIPVTSNFFALSTDGKSFVAGLLAFQLIDLNGNKLQTFTGHNQYVYSAAFSPDGKKILTGSLDKTARLWDMNGKTIQVFNGHTMSILSVAFSPDGNKILTGSVDETARLWDLKGNTLQVFKGHTSGIASVAFSPDGKTILTGSEDKTARLWDITGKTLQVFTGHTDEVSSVSFSPDGKTILTGSIDKTVRLWDLHGNTLQILSGYKTGVYSASFSPDGKTILTGSGDNTTKLIPVKISFNSFISTNGFEKLNLEQELKYGLISVDQINKEKNDKRLLDGLKYCISEVENQKERNSESFNETSSILKKLWGNINGITDKKLVYSLSLETFYLYPQKFISDMIEKENLSFLASSTKEEIKEAYEFYSLRCSYMDSVKIQLNIPDYFIRISHKLLDVDTTSKHIIATDLSALSWPLIQNRRFKTSLEAINLALEADSANPYIYSIYPLALLLNNRYSQAESVYRKYYKKFMLNNNYKSNQQIYFEDIADLEKRGITSPDFTRIKELLNH